MNLKFLALVLAAYSLTGHAADQRATIIHHKGRVSILKSPSAKALRRGKEVLYEGLYYHSKKARLGERVRRGEVVQTGPAGKVKLRFQNGDQFNVGAGTSYRLQGKASKSKKKKKGNVLNIFYGKMRAIVSKKGPRNDMQIKTKSAVAGVRGTDFFISEKPKTGTRITVLRGNVAVLKMGDKKINPQMIKTGFSAEVRPTLDADLNIGKSPSSKSNVALDSVSNILVRPTTKQQLIVVQATSSIKGKVDISKLTKEQKIEFESLSEKAKNVVVEDIRDYQPELLENVDTTKVSLEELNTKVVSKLFAKAPSAPKAKKPTGKDLEDIDTDIYKKYFKDSTR